MRRTCCRNEKALSRWCWAGPVDPQAMNRGNDMTYDEARQQLAMLLRNGQISEYHYQQELAALKYEYGEAMNAQDDKQGVSA